MLMASSMTIGQCFLYDDAIRRADNGSTRATIARDNVISVLGCVSIGTLLFRRLYGVFGGSRTMRIIMRRSTRRRFYERVMDSTFAIVFGLTYFPITYSFTRCYFTR